MEHQLKVGDRVMFRPYFDEPGFIYGRLDRIFERDSRVISDAGDIWFTMTGYLRKADDQKEEV